MFLSKWKLQNSHVNVDVSFGFFKARLEVVGIENPCWHWQQYNLTSILISKLFDRNHMISAQSSFNCRAYISMCKHFRPESLVFLVTWGQGKQFFCLKIASSSKLTWTSEHLSRQLHIYSKSRCKGTLAFIWGRLSVCLMIRSPTSTFLLALFFVSTNHEGNIWFVCC